MTGPAQVTSTRPTVGQRTGPPKTTAAGRLIAMETFTPDAMEMSIAREIADSGTSTTTATGNLLIARRRTIRLKPGSIRTLITITGQPRQSVHAKMELKSAKPIQIPLNGAKRPAGPNSSLHQMKWTDSTANQMIANARICLTINNRPFSTPVGTRWKARVPLAEVGAAEAGGAADGGGRF